MREGVFVRLDPTVVTWLRNEAAKRDRTLGWMINQAASQWKRRLDGARRRAEQARRRKP